MTHLSTLKPDQHIAVLERTDFDIDVPWSLKVLSRTGDLLAYFEVTIHAHCWPGGICSYDWEPVAFTIEGHPNDVELRRNVTDPLWMILDRACTDEYTEIAAKIKELRSEAA